MTITDPVRVAKVVQFVDARNSDWQTPWYGIPVPGVTAEFWRDKEFLGHLGAGPEFFETQRQGAFASRVASKGEVSAFVQLLDVDDHAGL